MKKNFWQLIWESFNKINGWLIGFGGIAITILLTRFPFKTSIPFDLVLIISFFTLLLIVVLLDVVNTLLNQNIGLISDLEKEKNNNKILINKLNQTKIPKIIFAKKEKDTGFVICLLEKSQLLANDLMISFVYSEPEGFEVSIGIGYIKNIQENNGKIQAVIHKPELSYQDILDRLSNNDNNVKERIVIKLGVTKSFIDQYCKGE